MHRFSRDLRYAVRSLRKSPGFTLSAVLTLALGVGATAAIFSCVYGLLLQSLPFSDAGRLVSLTEIHPQIPNGIEATFPDYQDWKAQQRSFTELAAYSTINPDTVSLVMNGRSEQVHRVLASGNFFSLLGIAAAKGRVLDTGDDAPGKDHVVVLSSSAWERYFGADPGVVGRSVDINGASFTVAGVLPAGAAYPAEGEVWLPLSLLDAPTRASRVWHSVRVMGRLRPGVTMTEANADLQTIAARLATAYPATNKNITARLTPLREQLIGRLRPAILSLMGAVTLILLIACANVANLLMVRATAARREVAVRQALGADRSQLFSQFLAQTLVLCLAGGGLGVAFAASALPLLRVALAHSATLDPAMIQSIGLSVPVLLFTLTVCTLTAVLFGLLPVMKNSLSLADLLRPGDRGNTGGHGRSRAVLVSGEIAVAVVVLFLSTLVIRSFQKLLSVDLGFRTDHLFSAEVTLPQPKYQAGSPEANHFFQRLLDAVAQTPGVAAVGTTNVVPLKPSLVMTRFLVEGAPPSAPGTFPAAQIRSVSPGFFRALGPAVQEGRVFEQKDLDSTTGAFVVNRAFADRYLAGKNPLGANLLIGVLSPQPVKIPVIGVVANAHDLGAESPAEPEMYLPGYGLHEVLLVRTTTDPAGIAPAVRRAMHDLDPNQPLYHVENVDALLADSTARQQMTATLLGIFSFVALALAGIGIYGVLAYSVVQRTREIGVRMAVGATRRHVVALILRQAGVFAGVGVAIGLALSFAGARLISGLLFNTSTVDPSSAAMAIAALLVAVALAAIIPAGRAASVSPNEALRAD